MSHRAPAIVRDVRYRTPGVAFRIWFARVFTLALLTFVLWIIAPEVSDAACRILGTAHPATVENVRAVRHSRTRTHYHVSYRYAFGGAERAHESRITRRQYENLVGQSGARPARNSTITVLVLATPWAVYAALPADRDWSYWLRAAVTFTLTPLAFLVFFWHVWLLPRRHRRLCATGTATPGAIIDKRTAVGRRSTSYFLRYAFAPIPGPDQTDEMRVDREAWETAHIGAPVTVLYLPGPRTRSLVYDFADYRCTPPPLSPT